MIYVDRLHPHRHSCYLDISLIRQTEYWIGFLKSSPKITLLLGTPKSDVKQTNSVDRTSIEDPFEFTSGQANILNHPAASHWACHVCGFSNPPEPKCGLCGVPRDSSASAQPVSAQRPPSSLASLVDHSTSHRPDSSIPLTRHLSDQTQNSRQALSNVTASDPTDHLTKRVEQALQKEISCPSCTFLNHPSMARCEMCDSVLGTITLESLTSNQSFPSNPVDSNQVDLQHSRATTPAPPASFPQNSYIRLSFRKGGDKTFYFCLKDTLQSKSWKTGDFRSASHFLKHSNPSEGEGISNSCQNDVSNASKPIGIDRILKVMDSQQQADQHELTEGLQDLRALMAKAKDMVQMAQSINARLTSLESNVRSNGDPITSDPKAGLVRSSLVKLGLPAPAVTPDMMASDQAFAKELAKELGGLLTRTMGRPDAIMAHGSDDVALGIRPLDEVWCIWNRARGISLVSPTDMILACHHLSEYTVPPIRLRTFRSGLRVLFTPHFSMSAFEHRLMNRLRNTLPGTSRDQSISKPPDAGHDDVLSGENRLQKMTTLEIAQSERLSVNLTTELLESIELGGSLEPVNSNDQFSSSTSTAHADSSTQTSSIVRDFDPQTGLTFWFENLISDHYYLVQDDLSR